MGDAIAPEGSQVSTPPPPPDKELNGQQVLFVGPSAPPAEWITRVKKRFPGLAIKSFVRDSWTDPSDSDEIKWDEVTVLLTGMLFPTPQQAPNLQFVQLSSAGSNFLAKKPLFTDTEVTFCSANGVHGPQISEWVISTFLAVQHSREYLPSQGRSIEY
jgi:phosphoglycerate dehydrogenase-like enzyme